MTIKQNIHGIIQRKIGTLWNGTQEIHSMDVEPLESFQAREGSVVLSLEVDAIFRFITFSLERNCFQWNQIQL